MAKNTIYEIERGRPPRHANAINRLADALGVSVEWLVRGEADPRRIAMLDAGVSPVRRVSEGGEVSDGATKPRVMQGLPYRVRVWLQEFLFDITKAGATEEQVQEARALLTSPEVFTFYVGGVAAEHTEEEILLGMEGIATFIRHQLRRRGLKLPAK